MQTLRLLRPLRLLSLTVALLAAPLLAQDDVPDLIGQIDENNIYTSADRFFRMPVPVLAELGGTVQDTAVTTTFRDPYGIHVTIGFLPIDDVNRAELEKRGRKDFLSWLFSQHFQPQYVKSFPGTTAESAKYLANTQEGALLVMNLIPGGTAFRDRVLLAPGEPAPVAKRGSLLFLKNDRVVILSTELYERALKRDTFKKTPEEEDVILRARLMSLLNSMTFAASSAPAAAPTAPSAPAK
jgi:hypothetical protein